MFPSLRPLMCILWSRGGRQTAVCATFGVFLFVLVHVIIPQFQYDFNTSFISHTQRQPILKPSAESEKKIEVGPQQRNETLQHRLADSCRTLNISLPVNDYMLSHMHFDHTRKVIYCFVPKVACTSWKRVWMKMVGIVEPDTDISTIDRYAVHTSLKNMASQKARKEELFSTYKKFLFVRHPFDRVLSAFKDKLESVDKKSNYNFHKEIGARIQRKYRGKVTEGHNTTFSEFIRFISEPGHGTFEQRNEHWLSVHEICNPCAVKYDFIGKYENINEDANYVLDWIGAKELIKKFPASDRPFYARRYDPKYFNQLSHSDKMAFFTKYLADFLAFDYDFL